jgi:hypothetical protein
VEKPIDLRTLITGIISSIAESQYEMDRNSINTAIRLLEEGLTEQMGLSARWYAIPEAEIIIKMMLEISKERELKSQMIDASYTSRYDVDTTLFSDFNIKIKRVPVEEQLNLTVNNEKQIVEKVSRIRNVAKLLHKYNNCFLNVFFQPFENDKSYTGGYWFIEVVHPPESTSKQTSGLILSAIIIVDDESGEIITAKYHQ